jgi:hypothetical protein
MNVQFEDWPDVPDLLSSLNRLQVEAKVRFTVIYDRAGRDEARKKPSGVVVFLTAKGWEAIQTLKTTMKETTTLTVHRQVTIDGQKIDIRSGEVYSILYGDLESLVESASAMCAQVLNDQVYLKTRRQCQVILHKVLRLRGQDIRLDSPETYDQIVDAINYFIHSPRTKS